MVVGECWVCCCVSRALQVARNLQQQRLIQLQQRLAAEQGVQHSSSFIIIKLPNYTTQQQLVVN
jgi:hypothetical protein